jgi:hypothetical protein
MPGWIKISVDETYHVVWKVRVRGKETCMHAIGDGAVGNRVTSEMAESRFSQGKCITPWLPVLFPHRAITLRRRSRNCVTAASRAVIRGWLFWP